MKHYGNNTTAIQWPIFLPSGMLFGLAALVCAGREAGVKGKALNAPRLCNGKEEIKTKELIKLLHTILLPQCDFLRNERLEEEDA